MHVNFKLDIEDVGVNFNMNRGKEQNNANHGKRNTC